MRIEHSLEIPAPVDRVWELTVDIAGWPDINPTVQSLELVSEPPLAVGSQARIKQRGQPERTWTVTRLDAPHHFEWETKVGPMRMAGIHHLVDTEGGCVNQLVVELSGPGSGLLGRLLRSQIRKAITLENEGFSAAAIAP